MKENISFTIINEVYKKIKDISPDKRRKYLEDHIGGNEEFIETILEISKNMDKIYNLTKK